MDAKRILLIAVTAARKAGTSVAPLFGHGLGKLLELADKDLEAAKFGLRTVLKPMVGQAVVRRIDAAENASALRTLAADFGFGSYFDAGRTDGDIKDDLLNEALPTEAQAQLAPAEIVAWLVGDKSSWWSNTANVTHLAEVADGVLENDQSLRGDFVTALDIEVVAKSVLVNGGAEVQQRFAHFVAGLRIGVKNSAVFDGKFLEAFTTEELVRHADADAVWDFCRDALRVAVTPAATPEPAPPALVTCSACGARFTDGRTSCECGQALGAPAVAVG